MNTKFIIICVVIALALGITALSITMDFPVADGVNLEEIQDCTTIPSIQDQFIYAPCSNPVAEFCNITNSTVYLNGSCFENPTEPEMCYVGTEPRTSYDTKCENTGYRLTIQNTVGAKTYDFPFQDWGACSYTPGGSSFEIVCDSKYDGNGDGICQPGETCLKYVISVNEMKKFAKNSGPDFVANDNTIVLETPQITEVN